MSRINLKNDRKPKKIKQYLGNTILFCEGSTEEAYFDLFKCSIEKSSKYNNLIIEITNAGGNAQRVLNYANELLANEGNNIKFKNYERYLVYDCDAPEKIEEVIKKSKESSNDYKLLISNPCFEIWLLMHYENVNQRLSKYEIGIRLKERMNVKAYSKGSEGHIRKIVGNGERVNLAIDNAKKLAIKYDNLKMEKDIKLMNPYTTVHELMELIF